MPVNIKEYVRSIREIHTQVKVFQHGDLFLVYKDYRSEPGIIKWSLVKASTLPFNIYPFEIDPFKRLVREYEAFKYIRGFETPRVLLVDYKNIIMIREYIRGSNNLEVLNSKIDAIGESLKTIHMQGVSLGDVKTSNFIYEEGKGKWFIIDAEQAVRGATSEMMIWDLLVFLSTYLFSFLESPSKYPLFRKSMLSFLSAYLEGNAERNSLSKAARSLQIRLLASLLLPHPYSRIFLEAIRDGRV
ncbi:hypothetical protein ACSU1N_06305 [Thermogladius sp. 4427co]|uniref:hypothetical protein n=1 Tax=Thermogladius sp. 4427co TaxID=3450718 RepID=UPI003F79EA76